MVGGERRPRRLKEERGGREQEIGMSERRRETEREGEVEGRGRG